MIPSPVGSIARNSSSTAAESVVASIWPSNQHVSRCNSEHRIRGQSNTFGCFSSERGSFWTVTHCVCRVDAVTQKAAHHFAFGARFLRDFCLWFGDDPDCDRFGFLAIRASPLSRTVLGAMTRTWVWAPPECQHFRALSYPGKGEKPVKQPSGATINMIQAGRTRQVLPMSRRSAPGVFARKRSRLRRNRRIFRIGLAVQLRARAGFPDRFQSWSAARV